MKHFFVETKYDGKIKLTKQLLEQLPSKISLALPIQFIPQLNDLLSQLKNKKVKLHQSPHSSIKGQILGCDILPQEESEAHLYIGDGKFHPTALLYRDNLPVYTFNPFNNEIKVYNQDFLKRLQGQIRGLQAKLYTSQKIGILVSTKSGQNRMVKAQDLKKELEKRGKDVYLFIGDSISNFYLEDFNFIEVWINTACPRIIEDLKALNIDDALEIIKSF